MLKIIGPGDSSPWAISGLLRPPATANTIHQYSKTQFLNNSTIMSMTQSGLTSDIHTNMHLCHTVSKIAYVLSHRLSCLVDKICNVISLPLELA